MPTIRIDDAVWTALKSLAVPLEDTPNSVLRRVLKLDEEPAPEAAAPKPKPERRGRKRSIERYRQPILHALADLGGEGRASEIMKRVYTQLEGDLPEADKTRTISGIPWRNDAQAARSKLIEEGLLDPRSPAGTWRLTNAGRAFARDAV